MPDTTSKSRRRLGRGLSSLISSPVEVAPPADTSVEPVRREQDLHDLALDAVQPNPHQPRRTFDEEALESLASSIRISGVMQPIVVRPVGSGKYELVAGERRLRAAGLAGLETIPAIVREVDSRTSAEWALVENLQREDLNPVERARAFARLISDFSLTHQEIADRVGLNRSSITNHLRLLDLDPSSLAALETGGVTLGHAKALLAITNLDTRGKLRERTIADCWSVRELERRAREAAAISKAITEPPSPSDPMPSPRSAHLLDLEKRLTEHFGTGVRIKPGKKKGAGELIIAFYDVDQFEGILERCDFAVDL